nr:reverse transcriptase domain-containing protein [Tanacetum cinerariifolium]
MPPKAMSQSAIERLITQRVNDALEVERAGRVNKGGEGSNVNEIGGQDRAPLVRECTFLSFMKCNPTPFHGKKGAIELCRWFEKSKMVFSISDCAERNKRFHELVLLCPEGVPTEKKKVEAYIKGLPENIKGETTSSRPVNMNEVEYKGHKPFCNNCKKHHNGNCWATCHNCERLSHRAKDCKRKSTPVCYECGEKGHTRNHCPKKNNPQGEQARGRAYVIKEADKDQRPNVVMDLMPIELGTFDVIIGMDWLVEQDAIIVCGKKVVHVPYKNKTLVVEGDRGAAPVARAPYLLAPLKMKELAKQLQELSEKGFIHPSSSP